MGAPTQLEVAHSVAPADERSDFMPFDDAVRPRPHCLTDRTRGARDILKVELNRLVASSRNPLASTDG
jgi:hypothetical protein